MLARECKTAPNLVGVNARIGLLNHSKANVENLFVWKILDKEIPYVRLIHQPTPVVEGRFGDIKFLMKREDLTDSTVYGGNKVRNLEFVLADALLMGKRSIATPIPLGSNFSAAFVGHAIKVGLNPVLHQVQLAMHPQILDHFEFCKQLKPAMTVRKGALKFPRQGLDLLQTLIEGRSRIVPPGASNVLGAIGHLKAYVEMHDQYGEENRVLPKMIFVGVGTGGTTAGLLAGMTLLGVKSKIIAVRCAEPIICNRRRILKLANQVLKFLDSEKRVDSTMLELIECPGNLRYGMPLADFDEVFAEFYSANHLELDRTYTSKVVKAMENYLKSPVHQHVSPEEILYWHTFSSMASKELSRKNLN